ncbi:MAG: hypothetical protein GX774_06630 [Armatimonadetes bacterium]|jgi:hypothetical protein|nr:hypothetical protein [Armatimonadota bacterium]
MATLGKILAGMMLLDGTLFATRGQEYLRLWADEGMPDCIRKFAEPYLQLNDEALRWLGIGEVALGVFIAALSARAEA